ncbi:uncharacterized protein LOC142100228 isoform X2 [Mixophyes fleayi]|uniref:uncharacterized protein LOC142100228 isoform X2 n=1 Tax=Mixophyes fleayi TaxID=3061075 RepID=UPI003F4DF381
MGGLQILLVLGTLQGYHSQTIHVSQIPVIFTPEGSSVTLPCTYSISGAENIRIGSYKWYRHMVGTGPEVSDSNKDFTGRISREDTDQFITSSSAGITLHRVHVSDTGMYYCDVTFQHGGEISGHGPGTFLNVTALESQSVPGLRWSIPLTITGVVISIAVLLVIGYRCHTKLATRSSKEVGPIIYTDFLTDRRHNGLGSPALPQSTDDPQYTMENQHYTLETPQYTMETPQYTMETPQYTYVQRRENARKPHPQHCQEGDLYSVIT